MDHVGGMLRHWRKQRRYSQQQLADDAEISPRHLSCLETGRSKPSREMLLILASALDVPLRERNTLLLAGGFAPAYRCSDLDGNEMAPVRNALDHMLRHAEPYGALVMNRRWDLLMANRPFSTMAGLVLGRPLLEGENMIALTMSPTGFRPFIRDSEALCRGLLLRIHRDAVATDDAQLFELLEELCAIDGAPSDWRRDAWLHTPPVALTIDIELGGEVWSLFTTLTTMGTPTDVTLSELHIEHYFPADAATDAAMRAAFSTLGPAA